jgi:uncharacterized protein
MTSSILLGLQQMQEVRRILAIDGGGIKGVFPAAFLTILEDAIEDKVSNYFDLIVGTSTGGIVALGIGLGFSASEILEFYQMFGPSIFKQYSILSSLKHFALTKYSNKPLYEALQKTFGDRLLGESANRLLIPSLNLDTGEAYLYKTAHHKKLERDYKERAVTVAMATSAAPTFFPTHLAYNGTALVDGGMWANNPTGIATIEAVTTLGWPSESLRILSIGCTQSPMKIRRGRLWRLGKLYWAAKASEIFMSGQSTSALGTAKLFAGEENVLRVNPVVPTGRFSLDGVKAISPLQGLGETEARKLLPKIRQMFLTKHVEPFQPYY